MSGSPGSRSAGTMVARWLEGEIQFPRGAGGYLIKSVAKGSPGDGGVHGAGGPVMGAWTSRSASAGTEEFLNDNLQPFEVHGACARKRQAPMSPTTA